MKDKIQKYLNQTGWSTITWLTEKFEIPRHEIALILTDILADQNVRVYDGKIVHV